MATQKFLTDIEVGGDLTLSKSVGDTVVIIESDTDNNAENDNPRLEFKQDGGAVFMHTGTTGNVNFPFTNALVNHGYLRSSTGLQFVVNSTTSAMTIDTSANTVFAGTLTIPSYIYHNGDTDTYFGFTTGDTFHVYTGGSERFKITGDVHVKGSTDFAIPAGRKLYLDGQSNTYITESSADNIKFFTGGSEALLLDSSQNATFAGDVTVSGTDIRTGAHNGLDLGDDSSVLTIGQSNELWALNDTDSDATLYLNHRGYNAASTRFRSFEVRDGKGSSIVNFNGSDKKSTFAGEVEATSLDINGNADISGDLGVAGAIYQTNNGTTSDIGVFMPMVQGGLFASTSGGTTGRLRIKVPTNTSLAMQTFYIDIYEYDTDRSQTYRVSGYNYNDTNATWYNTSVVALFDSDNRDLTVRFGADTSAGEQYVAIGETNTTWTYVQVVVRDYLGGYNTSVAEATAAFEIEFVTTDAATYNVNHDNNQPMANWSKIESIPANVTNALPTTGGTMSGAIAMGNQNISGVGNLSVNAGSLSITGDGSNAVTLTESGSGDFTIDAPDDIRLDAGGGDVVFKDDGTEIGRISNNNPGLTITSSVANSSINLTPNGTGNVYANTDTLIVSADEGETASILLRTDQGDDNGDDWYIYNGTDNVLDFTNDISGSQVNMLTLTPNATATNSVATFAGEVEAASLDINGNADISGTLDVAGDTTFTADVYVHHNNGLQIGDTGNSSTARTTLTSFNNGGNSKMLIKGGNFLHQIDFETSKNDFKYANLTASYNGGASELNLYQSNSDTTGTAATTTISTGTSTFAGNVTAGSNSLTAGSLDINGAADISGGLVLPSVNDTHNFKAFGGDSDSYFQLSDDANNSVNVLLTRSDGAEVFKIMGHTQAATFGGDLTVSGGDITLGGTGRIQGIDTVSASTDAASKAYVDGAVIANTDTQDLSQSGNTVSLVNGGSVDISTTTAVAANTAKTSNIVQTTVSGSSGSCTGNAATATLAATSTIASDTGSATHFPVFVDGSTGSRALKAHSSWNYNPGTSTLTAGKITTDTASIVENAKSNAALMTLTGAGAGNEANISLKLAGTVHGSPIKMKLVAETTGGDPAGNGLLSYHPDTDTFGIGQTTTHNSMAILIDNNDAVSMKNETTFTNGVDVTSGTNSTSKTTGTVKIAGGVGIVKALNVGEDVVAYASSDKRYKDNLQAITNPIDKVKSLTGYTFTWNDKHEQFNGNNDIGVVAQEVEKVFPEIVDTRDNGYKAVKYEKMVAVLIEAIKDQQKQIDELKAVCSGCSK